MVQTCLPRARDNRPLLLAGERSPKPPLPFLYQAQHKGPAPRIAGHTDIHFFIDALEEVGSVIEAI